MSNPVNDKAPAASSATAEAPSQPFVFQNLDPQYEALMRKLKGKKNSDFANAESLETQPGQLAQRVQLAEPEAEVQLKQVAQPAHFDAKEFTPTDRSGFKAAELDAGYTPFRQFNKSADPKHTLDPGPKEAQQFGGLQKVNGEVCAVFYDGRTPIYVTEKEVNKMMKSSAALGGDMSKSYGGSDDINVRNASFYLAQARDAFRTVKDRDLKPGQEIEMANGFKAVYAKEKTIDGLDLKSNAHYNDSFLRMTQNVASDPTIKRDREAIMVQQMGLGYVLPEAARERGIAQPKRPQPSMQPAPVYKPRTSSGGVGV